jgi:hypothetical protein
MASEYGWTREYCLYRLTLPQASRYIDCWSRRQRAQTPTEEGGVAVLGHDDTKIAPTSLTNFGFTVTQAPQ